MTLPLHSIGRLLAVIISATLLPSAILAFGLVWYGYEQSVERTERSTVAAVRALSSGVDERLLQSKFALDALSTSPALANQDWVTFHAQSLEFLRKNPIAVNILVFDGAEGAQVLNTLRPPGTELPPAAVRGRREMDAFALGADWVTSVPGGRSRFSTDPERFWLVNLAAMSSSASQLRMICVELLRPSRKARCVGPRRMGRSFVPSTPRRFALGSWLPLEYPTRSSSVPPEERAPSSPLYWLASWQWPSLW
ncbi:hypothetical protein FN976_17255 [Caenimonas sedimenti]|uniref:CHASE4 domain-containing protein n=1 Tax=Caenimonas sedimenti TaxID=2596921 RepID=A0A562ZPJ4_9BURK|nr:hypothetical protein [Caenimonas sedimenti]TWO70084.1 hypothetical protein FN976_17255 [Caenimonas sedimenti]